MNRGTQLILLATGVVACSVAGILVRASHTPAILIAAYRLLLASALLAPCFARTRRRYPEVGLGGSVAIAIPAAVLLGLHFWSWNVSLGLTTVANATLIVNLVPVAMPFVVWSLTREGVRRREITGSLLALAGTALLAVADCRLNLRHAAGDFLALASMVAFAAYLAWNRRCMHMPSVWLYIPPVYLLSGLFCLGLGAFLEEGVTIGSAREWLILLGLAAVPTVVGHSALHVSMRHLRSQTVATATLGQFIPAGLLAWLIFAEVPSLLSIPAAVLVITGALVVIRAGGARADPS
jgi:drug/metabolite transporter (DMT)-like permease